MPFKDGLQLTTGGALLAKMRPAVVPSTALYRDGWARDSDGYAYLESAGSAVPTSAQYRNGMAFTPDGALYVTGDLPNSSTLYRGGLAIRPDGAVHVIGGTPSSAPVYGLARSSSQQMYVSLSDFFLPLADAGSGAVNTSLIGGTGSATFTRAGNTATTTNSSGTIISVAANIPRSYYDPTTLAYLGYLAEGARTNLVIYSQDRSQANWPKSLVTVGGSFTAPDGATSTVSKVMEDNSFGNHYIEQIFVKAASSITYTYSEFLKADERNFIQLTLDDAAGNGFDCMFNVSAGTVSTSPTLRGSGWSAASASIKAYPNGVYRASLTATSNTATTVRAIPLLSSNGTLNETYTGTTGSGAYIWGAQLEAGSFASSYIPTTTASVTRNADVLTYPSSGNVSATAGTIYAEATPLCGNLFAVYQGYVSLNDGTANETIRLNRYSQTVYMDVVDGGSLLFEIGGGDILNGATGKTAESYSLNNFAITVNGATPTTSGTGTIPTFTTISVGSLAGGANTAFAAIRNVRIFQNQLTASQLQAITS